MRTWRAAWTIGVALALVACGNAMFAAYRLQ